MDGSDPFWRHAVRVNILEKKVVQWSDILYFVDRFKAILQYDNHEIDRLYEECFQYKIFAINVILDKVFADAIVNEGTEDRVDVLWHYLAHMKQECIGDNYRFRLLFNVARLAIITPH